MVPALPLPPPPAARTSPSPPARSPPAARRGPYGEASRLLFQFKTPEDLERWAPFSDAELGGQSTAALKAAADPPVRAPLPALPHAGPAACLALHWLPRQPAPRPQHTRPACAPLQGTAVLAGRYSSALGEGADARLRRSGFAGITSRAQGAAMDLEDFDALVFRWVGGGGRGSWGCGKRRLGCRRRAALVAANVM